LETRAFLSCLKCFLSLTGNTIHHIRSDQATTFVGAINALSRELSEAVHKMKAAPQVQKYLQKTGIDWEFLLLPLRTIKAQ